MIIPAAQWVLIYEGSDVTADIAPEAISIAYVDFEHGKSDEIEVRLKDRSHRWKGAWLPSKGDLMNLKIGWAGALLPCGEFEVDEIGFEGPPDVVVIRGLAAPVSAGLRTERTRAFENKTLRQIAEQIASEHGLTLEGEIEEGAMRRVTQYVERDLEFLRRLAGDYDHVVSVRGKMLYFAKAGDLERQTPAASIPRAKMGRFSFRDSSRQIYKACALSYHDPETSRLIKVTVEAEGVTTGDVLEVKARVESEAQARIRAAAELKRANARALTGRIDLKGDPRLAAGVVIEIPDLGALSGRYLIETSRHRIERRAGYVTEVELRHVQS
ncbi:phage late control D family protein [Neomegalonema sp.]|uniref:phage late control D family protein n=1 Tax=Neomegalonema sp. TaxID=2039713 RepID=UPI0026105706|nr:contractile injection system protein, VgrG/Pvc8 family [Neomegalonema sp.]MDD2870077.1 contractile injection system protein, VgrG/Pvc8 family [Neomegalonema sp.]